MIWTIALLTLVASAVLIWQAWANHALTRRITCLRSLLAAALPTLQRQAWLPCDIPEMTFWMRAVTAAEVERENSLRALVASVEWELERTP